MSSISELKQLNQQLNAASIELEASNAVLDAAKMQIAYRDIQRISMQIAVKAKEMIDD